MFVLGISCFYHDSSATLLRDGVVVAAVAEERFTRIKHDTSFPVNAIVYCLENQNITIQDISYVGFYEKPLLKFERVLYQYLETFPSGIKTFLKSMPSWINEKLMVRRIIRKKLKYAGDIFFIPHHLAHAASAFLVSPFKQSAIVTVDGVGEWTTATIGIGDNNSIKLIKEQVFPHSIGLLYSTITAYLGFHVNDAEYKVMGLSSYGLMDKDRNPYYQKLKRVIDIKKDGSYRLDFDYFVFHHADKMPSKRLCNLLDGPVRKPESVLTQRHKDVAAALQIILEEVMTKILKHAHHLTECENVVLAGGVALNSVYNGKILKNTLFKNVWIQPDAGDGGTSMGAALYVYNSLLRYDRKFVLGNIYLGPLFSTRMVEQFLDKNNIQYYRFKDENGLVDKTAKLIYENNIVGWFQGRMEWGPRALGARSILANPLNPEMQNILNKKVKHREEFRPFAPAVLYEEAPKYFEVDNPLPAITDFMLMVYPAKKEWTGKIPSVVHVDGSARLQTVREKWNPLYYQTIKKFGRLSGVPIIINTSFNVRGEPIVCSPLDAYKCMMGTKIDYLVMDKFLISRKSNE
ncbi:MAG: hypothetical protein A2665_02495 [Candidatus Zambryskibacteria bacterium RIFCSPHIGHO2_01_FULL_46_30]|uniref:Carbamoyltransferase n=1 Tax=Candidatus Zambryskibacteria bacterium RIFCSPHIGHO2_01_FULL_46_30 TaxID=1802739 RepID=A0A1G2T0F3_9BACT|nr:MAG: hypothetical protein A2665_02495 [Candidatus Zambryskibacteria bacterium RIFCSPHIGHO2_01_FULL_46_30]OHB06690.1 MAG: hypothetical protein A3B22_00995 [Candidatus Zambryskibacteria bacterium RIFCSPLOWO2_01_FULL_47_33]